MSQFLALNISISQDGYMAGPNQSLEAPLGEKGKLLFEWVFPTKAMKEWFGEPGGSLGIDNDYAARGFHNIGATIMGRNMFGPIRGPWLDEEWKGWWGPTPGFAHPVFVLTHHPSESRDMGNGTVFHFVTGGIGQAYEMSERAAGEKDIRVGGGADTLHQFLEAGLLDEIHVARIPVELRAGELLFSNPELQLRHYRLQAPVDTLTVQHQTYLKK